MTQATPAVRPAHETEIPQLADLWYKGWIAAHKDHVPNSLTAIRTLESFEIRLLEHLKHTRVVGAMRHPLGLCIINDNEIYQIFVSPPAQGTGAARALISDGLDQIRRHGHQSARLDVIPQNGRAIAFYTKMGWQKGNIHTVLLETLNAPYPLECLEMTKKL